MKRRIIVSLILVFTFASIGFVSLPVLAFNNKYDETFFSNANILGYNPQDASCSLGDEVFTLLEGANNREKIWKLLNKSGLSPEQSAGVLSGIEGMTEGSYSPTVNETGETFPDGKYGIGKWGSDRRTNIVDLLKTTYPELMKTYYISEYSSDESRTAEVEGYLPKNSSTGELMPTEDNDRLLGIEFNYLIDELKNRTLHQPAIDKGYGISKDTEWGAIIKQKTPEAVSDIMVYSFEIPENDIDTIAKERAKSAISIFDLYNSAEKDSNINGGCSAGGGSKKQLATDILASGNISYWSDSSGNATEQILKGLEAGTNNGNDWPCGININILKMLKAITTDHKIVINDSNRACIDSTAGGDSSPRSGHYAGNGSALDFGFFDGGSPYANPVAQTIIDLIAPYLVSGSRVGQEQCVNLTLPDGVSRLSDACTHLHVDVQPNTDIHLKCKIPIVTGGCDEGQRVE